MTEQEEPRIIISDKKRPSILDLFREVLGVTIPEELINKDEENA